MNTTDFTCHIVTAKGYSHFDGSGTGSISGGPSGKCPTYDNFHMRRNNEVAQAEAEALKKVRDANPHLKAEDLKIDFDEAVQDPPRRHPGGLARPAQLRPRGTPPLPGEYPQRGLPVPVPLEVEMRNPYAQHHAYRPPFDPRDRNTANGIENDPRWAARADRGFGNRDLGDRDYRREQRERAHRDYRDGRLREAQEEVALMARARARYEEAHKRDENVGMHRLNDGAPQTRHGLRYGDDGERADPYGQGFQMPPTFREVRDRARWDGSRRQR